MSDTPETDAFFFRTDIEWDDEVEFARKLERERDEARMQYSTTLVFCQSLVKARMEEMEVAT